MKSLPLVLLFSCALTSQYEKPSQNKNSLLIRTEFIKFEQTRDEDFPITRESQNDLEQIYQNVDTFIYSGENKCGPLDRFTNFMKCGNVYGSSIMLSNNKNNMGIFQTEEMYMRSDMNNGEYIIKTRYSSDCVVVSRESNTCIRHSPVVSRVTVTVFEKEDNKGDIIFQKTYCINFDRLNDNKFIEYDIVSIIKNDSGFSTKNITHSDRVKLVDNRERCGG